MCLFLNINSHQNNLSLLMKHLAICTPRRKYCTVCQMVTHLWSSGQSSWLQIQRSWFNSRRYQIFWEVVGLQLGPLSLVSTIKDLLERKSTGSSLESREYGCRDSSCWPRGILYPQKLALTSPTSGGRLVGIVFSQTPARELVIYFILKQHLPFVVLYCFYWWYVANYVILPTIILHMTYGKQICQLTFSGLHGIISQKIELKTTVARTSSYYFFHRKPSYGPKKIVFHLINSAVFSAFMVTKRWTKIKGK
jgi:hypothetical protein